MTEAERKAYKAGQNAIALNLKAPCYDKVMRSMVIEARSMQGHDYNQRIMTAWYAGRGIEQPID